MLLRKNTKLFKTILAIVEASQTRPDREKLIRLFITKVGDTADKRLAIEGIPGDAGVFYEMTYQTVLNNLRSSNHQLYESDDIPGVYFFHSSNKSWDETPFEFDEAIKDEFASLSDLPNVRKKEKAGKVVLPTSKTRQSPKPAKKEKTATKKSEKPVTHKSRPHSYKGLKKEIEFNNLDKIVYRQPQLTRKDVLDYYDKVADHILPHLRDRPLTLIAPSDSGRRKEYATWEALSEAYEELPDWLDTFQKSKNSDRLLLCSNKEHLMFYASLGCVQFNCWAARTKSLTAPDYIVIALSTDAETAGLIQAAQMAQTILNGLHLPSLVKTDGASGLHLFFPLDANSKFDILKASEYLGKLIRLKSPDRISLSGSDDYTYGKIALDYNLNSESATIIAPYSLFAGEVASVATPINWDEAQEDFRFEELTPDEILKRLKREGEFFESLFRKKINGDELLERLEEGYSFLL